MALIRRDVILSALVLALALILIPIWIPLFRYISYAFVTGILTTIFTISVVGLTTSGKLQINTALTEYNPKFIALVESNKWKAEVGALRQRSLYRRDSLYPASFVISDGLDELLRLLQRDFIGSWYNRISRNPIFINEVDKNIRIALGGIRDRASAVDVVEMIVSRFVPIITEHLKDFYNAERVIRGKNLSRDVTESEELDLAIAGKYRHGRLHPAASLAYSDTKLVQQEYLRKTVEKLVPELLPESQIRSRAVLILIKEIVACAVLSPLMQLLSSPDTWNQLLEAYGRTMLQDRKTVRKLRAALDQHTSPASKSKASQVFPKLYSQDSERKFEKFIRAARTCNNLSDARRFRNEVSSQLKKDSRVEGQDQVYLRRLETGKRILDQKVLSLAGGTLIPTSAQAMAKRSSSSRMEHASLVQVLHDASGLSYFMEYMDRQRKMPIVQFWIVVDGLRNPLESDIADDEDFPHPPPEWSESDRLDILQINEAYLARKELKIPEQSRELVRTFVKAGRAATPVQYQKARAAILSAQTSVLHEMERECFPGFRQSDLFYKYLSTDEASTISTKPPPPVAPNFSPLLTSKTNRPKPELKTRATAMPPPQVPPSLLRNAASTSDLKESAPLFDDGLLPRRSLDTGPHPPLFDDDQDADPLSRSRQSIDTDRASGDGDHGPDTQVVQAMEAALTDIMDDKPNPEEDLRDALFGTPEPSLMPAKDGESPRDSLDSSRVEFSGQLKDGEKPSIASLGLVNTSSRIGVFFDDDLFPDEEKFLQDEHEDSEEKDVENKDVDDDIHRAAPGDLGLAEAIAALSLDIDKLVAQDAVVDTLTRKAELTNNAAELRILKKSKSSLEREMRRKELQRQQYIVQESDNSLYGRSDVKIKSIMVGTSDDGHEYALYVVEVQRNAGEQMAAATWAIARRYSEFHDLHQRLRMKYPSVRNLEFPRRRVVMKLQKDFLQKRRVALEKYLRELLQLPDVCRSRDLRAFLSQSAITSPEASIDPQTERQHIISRFYNSVSDGVEDFLGNIPVLDQLSVAGQNLISAATSQLGNNASTLPVTIAEDPLAAAEAEQELKAFEDREIEPFVKPICDIFLELFELNRGNNWLRGRAVVVVLHQLLGGTIERKVRDNAKQLVQDDSVLKYLDMIKETMWPNDVLKTDWKPRTMAEKNKSRTEASLMLATLLPDVAGNVVGRANAQVAARRVFATMNNARLNTHLAFTMLDEIVDVLFGK